MSTAADFIEWLKGARPGGSHVYFIGHLARARTSIIWDDHGKVFLEKVNERVEALAQEVWKAYTKGKVVLVQKRIGTNIWHYIAIRRGRRVR